MTLKIEKRHELFVGEVSGVDISHPLETSVFEKIQSKLDELGVLIFHTDKLSEQEQIDFSTQFGDIAAKNGILFTGVKRRLSEKLVDISNLDYKDDLLAFNDRRRMEGLSNRLWHTDSSFKRIPAKYSVLHAHSVVSEGGETQFVDMRAAYEALSPKLQGKIADLVAEHSIFVSRAKMGFTDFSDEERAALPPVHRALVRNHESSGRKALYHASHASHIIDWSLPDGKMLLLELMEHATQPQFVFTHKWEVGDLIIWDNRCTMHRAMSYEASERRDMRRATIDDPDVAVHDLRIAS